MMITLDIKVGDKGEIVLSGRFDASQAAMAETVLGAVTESRVLDLGDLQYISSLGLGVLLATQKRLMASGHQLKLVNVRGHVREVFHYAGFDAIFEIDPKPQS
jgi:anti-sigma B factor antagonist